jgi:tripartite-type tricarboxylate transporter receptor subunit TctC
MMHSPHVLSMTCAALILAAYTTAAFAQQSAAYPSRAIRMVVPFPPGGGTDIVARSVGQKLGEALGEPVVMDHRGGAGGNIGVEIAAKAAPDGHTLVIVAATHAINVTLYRKLGYDLVKDFAPISPVASMPYTLVANTTVPIRSAGDLVKLARDKPGQLNYSSAGSGTGTHLAMEIFKSAANLDIVHIPYKGSAPATTELLAGQVQVMFGNTASVLPQIKAGKLRALAVTSAKRQPLLPDVPSIAESAVPQFEVIQWYGVLAPAGTPKAIVQKLNAALAKIAQMPDFKERLYTQGAEPMHETPEQFAAFIRAEIAKWAVAVRSSGARVD